MKKITVLISSTILLLISGCRPDPVCSDIVYNNKIFSYIELREGMRLNIKPTATYYKKWNALQFVVDFLDIHEGKSRLLIDNIDEVRDYIPGKIGFTQEAKLRGEGRYFPTYASTHNQSRYDTIAKEVKDEQYNHKWCASYLEDGGGRNLLMLGLSVLYNKLDSMKLVCVSHAIGSRTPHASLNDITFVHAVRLPPSPRLIDEPITAQLDSFYIASGKGTRFLNVFDMTSYYKDIPTYLTKISTLVFSLNVNQFDESYRFKLYFYLDDGKLTIESNEFGFSSVVYKD